MEQVVARENMVAALAQVTSNKGAAGIDGMKVRELKPYLRDNWARIREELLGGVYKPQPVRRVEIPKPDGGVRLLGTAAHNEAEFTPRLKHNSCRTPTTPVGPS